MKKLLLVLMIVIIFIAAYTAQSTLPASTPVPFTETTAATETLIPTSTFTMTPPPTATPIPHPMSIVAMRVGEYPGSEITIVKELDKGANYRRYYSYYLSEGLKIYALLTIPEGEMPEGGWPAIVFNHGYIPPEFIKQPKDILPMLMKLRARGMLSFALIIADMMHQKAKQPVRMVTPVIKLTCSMRSRPFNNCLK